jgi:hypothetical protein
LTLRGPVGAAQAGAKPSLQNQILDSSLSPYFSVFTGTGTKFIQNLIRIRIKLLDRIALIFYAVSVLAKRRLIKRGDFRRKRLKTVRR